MADDTEKITDERATEMSSVAAIYPELLIDPSNRFSATIDIPVEPNKPLAIFSSASSSPEAQTGPLNPTIPGEVPPDCFRSFPVSSRNSDLSQVGKVQDASIEEPLEDIHLLSNLPPLILQIILPDGYPSQNPPHFFLSTNVPWIPTWRLQELQDAGHTLWQEIGKDQVVFTYIDHLREAAENGFNLASQEADYLKVTRDLKLALLDFDLKAKRAKFEQKTFQCSICLEPKKGVKCHRLSLCSHVFCVGCLQDFFNTCISEGDVSSVKCIAPGCGEDSTSSTQCTEDRTLDPNELLQIPLSQEQVQRYVTLKRKKKYEADPTTVYCPRTWCQGPARTTASEAAEASLVKKEGIDSGVGVTKSNGANSNCLPPADRLAICQDCRFAFCQVCKASWHGELKWCSVRNKGELTAEEKASEEYMKLHCTPCPTCTAPCQKTMGCNHMICPTCRSHFCYLCSSWLNPGNPYEHFNNVKSPCYMRLWELEGGDGGKYFRYVPSPFQAS